ncbi:hypothetical protein DFAR_880003 [Desulfarculales bacterium]
MLERRRIANQVLSGVAYYPKWLTFRGTGAPHRVESLARLKRAPHWCMPQDRLIRICPARGSGPVRAAVEAKTAIRFFVPCLAVWPYRIVAMGKPHRLTDVAFQITLTKVL